MQPFDASHWPTRVVFGPGPVASLPDLLAGLGTHRVAPASLGDHMIASCPRPVTQAEIEHLLRAVQ